LRYILLEHHPNDSRLKIAADGICQTLNQRMGTGGGNVPLILEIRDGDYTETFQQCNCDGNRNMPDS